MTNGNLPKLSDAEEADKADAIQHRPTWFNIESVTGKVSRVEARSRQTPNGNTINEFIIIIPEPRDVRAAMPVTGAAELAVISPFLTGNNLSQQPYHWLVKSAQAVDPSINDIAGLEGKEWTFFVDQRNRFLGERKAPTMFYNAKAAGGAVKAVPAFTREELYETYEAAQGMTVPDAYVKFTRDKIERLMLGKMSDGTVLDFGLKTVEGKLVAS